MQYLINLLLPEELLGCIEKNSRILRLQFKYHSTLTKREGSGPSSQRPLVLVLGSELTQQDGKGTKTASLVCQA